MSNPKITFIFWKQKILFECVYLLIQLHQNWTSGISDGILFSSPDKLSTTRQTSWCKNKYFRRLAFREKARDVVRFGNVISCSDYRGTRDEAIYLSTFWQRRERVVWRDVGNSIFDVGSFLCINRDDIFSIISVRKRRVDGCGRSDEQHSFTNLQKSVRKLVKASFKLVKIKATLDGNYEKDPFTGSFSSFHLWQIKVANVLLKLRRLDSNPGPLLPAVPKPLPK